MPKKREPGPQQGGPGPEQNGSGLPKEPETRRVPTTGHGGADPSDLLPRRFLPAQSESAHAAGPNRDAPGARVTRTGWTRLNVEATRIAIKAAGYPSDFVSMGVYFRADPAMNEVAGCLVQSGYRGLTPLRYLPKSRAMVVYLHNIFKDFPQLRPTSEKWVSVSERTEDGKTFFLLQLGLGLRRKHGTRGGGSDDRQ